MFKIDHRPQFNGDNQGQGDGTDYSLSDGDNQVQSGGFDSYGPPPVPAYDTESGVIVAGTNPANNAGAGSGGSTVVSIGGSLSFSNTYSAGDTTAYENDILAAELTLENLLVPSINAVTINVTFNESNGGNSGVALGNSSSGWNVSFATLKSALQATGEGDLLPSSDPSGGANWYVPASYAAMLGIGSNDSTDLTVTLNTFYPWDFTQDVVNGLEHEITEGGFGRIGELGGTGGLMVGQSGGGPYTGPSTTWSTMDLFTYNAAGNPDYSNGRDGQPTYFKGAGGLFNSDETGLSFNQQFNSSGTLLNTGDTDDWNQNQVFGSTGTGESLTLVQTELYVMQALGWDFRLPQDIWVTAGAGNWTDLPTLSGSNIVSNWETNYGDDYVPIAPQDAYIGTAFNNAQVTSSSNETVNSISSAAGSTLIIAGGSTFTATEGTVLSSFDTSSKGSGLLGTLDVDPGSTLVIGAPSAYSVPPTGPITFDNAGTINLGFGGGFGVGYLEIDGSVTFNGKGTINLGVQNFSSGFVENYPSTNGTLINVDNTITGGGIISLYSFDNQASGTVEASQTGAANSLQIYGTHSFTNEGSMVAETGATLDLGQDLATGALTNTGTINLDSGSDLALSGNSFTISGSGDIGIKGAGADITSDANGIINFVNESDIEAFASGQIGDVGLLGVNELTFENVGGTVLAFGSGVTLTLNTGSTTIDNGDGGTFLAEGGAHMVIDSPVNLGFKGAGAIEALAGSEVIIAAAISSGGAVEIIGNGTIDLASGGSIASPLTYSGSGGTLEVDSAADAVTGQISGFAAGDFIDARFMPFTSKVSVQWVENGGGTAGTLTLSNGVGTSMTFNINGDFLPNFNFQVSNDGSGGTLVSLQSPNPSVPAGTDDVMVMSGSSNGDYEIYDLGGNALLAGYSLGQAASPWTFAGLGGFDGSDTADMILRATSGPSAGAFEVYDISNNSVTNAALLGTIGLEWTVAGFGDFSSNPGETDMLLRDSSTGAFEVYDIHNNAIISAAALGTVGTAWTVAGFGDFSGNANETDMLLRNSSTGAFEVYDISHNAITLATSMGAVGAPWTVAGFGDFSGNPGESDMLMRNSSTGAFEVYDISHNAITNAAAMGTVGLEWTVAGFGDISGKANETDMLMRDSSTGAFEIYDISHNAITSAASMGSVGLEWTVAGIAADPPSGAAAAAASMGPLVASSLHAH